ncbi:hypothetical protein AB835_02805 [Candidatus Endobugula sertula]|uniref:Prolyl 4-hydroxylase alpha subunit Fe(2+) 2OG dioxygenase domain-containing protein n=1 Tax=Candidatus Endobugula sertula TaxID=62101 RepID=A0A1D2QSM3_9GAMM|nr:hypothetical protein AB835_02805 [Candidatus Endobugula sertula]
MQTIINYNAIDKAVVKQRPYPFFGSDNAFSPASHAELLKNFPKITSGGSFPLDAITTTAVFNQLVEEIKSDQFRHIIEKKFSVDLKDKPLVITARGFSRQKDGRIHKDSKTKLITILLYINDGWDYKEGRLRILKSDNLNDYETEFASSIGQMIAFKVTDNCWHGYQSYEGQRQSLQINYLVEEKYTKHHVYRHKLSAFFKKNI